MTTPAPAIVTPTVPAPRIAHVTWIALSWVGCLAVLVHGYLTGLRAMKWPGSLPDYTFSDLHVYLGALHALARDGTLYDYTASNGCPFTYPPFAGIVMSPMVAVDANVLTILWPLAVLLACVPFAVLLAPQLARLTARWWPVHDWLRTPVLPLSLVFVAGSQIVASNLLFGQVSLFIALLALVDAARVVPPRYRGIATGIAAAVKLTPLAFVPYLWFTGQRRAAVTAAGTFAACTGLGWLFMPGDSIRYWFTELWQTNRVGVPNQVGNVSVKGLLTRLGMTGGTEQLVWILLIAVIVIVGLYRATRADRAGYPLLGAAIAGTISVCVSPVSWTHHAIWLVIAMAGTLGAAHHWRRFGWPFTVLLVTAVLMSYTIMQMAELPDWLRAVFVDTLPVLAIAIACLIPFNELRAERTRT